MVAKESAHAPFLRYIKKFTVKIQSSDYRATSQQGFREYCIAPKHLPNIVNVFPDPVWPLK